MLNICPVLDAGRPDMTFTVDWPLNNNYLSIYLLDAAVTLSEEQGHQTEKRVSRPLVGLSSQQI